MSEFSFYMPAKIFFGKNCVRQNAAAMAPLGRKALIVTGKHSAKAVGALSDITDALSANGQNYTVFDEVTPNPTIDLVYRGADIAKSDECDFVICIGGGSPMDAGKAIALIAGCDPTRGELFSGKYRGSVLPIVAVPTTAGTGSEVTKASIITNDSAQTKSSISYEGIFPSVSYCDGKYTMTLSHSNTADTVTDALSHAIEGYLNSNASSLTDLFAEEAIRIISRILHSVADDTLTADDRDALLYASTLAGIVIANNGTTLTHAMGYELTYFKETPHGRANGYLLPALFHFYESRKAGRLQNVLDLMGLKNIGEFEKLLNSLLTPPDYSLSDDEIHKYASIAIKAGNIKNSLILPDEADIVSMYRYALG